MEMKNQHWAVPTNGAVEYDKGPQPLGPPMPVILQPMHHEGADGSRIGHHPPPSFCYVQHVLLPEFGQVFMPIPPVHHGNASHIMFPLPQYPYHHYMPPPHMVPPVVHQPVETHVQGNSHVVPRQSVEQCHGIAEERVLVPQDKRKSLEESMIESNFQDIKLSPRQDHAQSPRPEFLESPKHELTKHGQEMPTSSLSQDGQLAEKCPQNSVQSPVDPRLVNGGGESDDLNTSSDVSVPVERKELSLGEDDHETGNAVVIEQNRYLDTSESKPALTVDVVERDSTKTPSEASPTDPTANFLPPSRPKMWSQLFKSRDATSSPPLVHAETESHPTFGSAPATGVDLLAKDLGLSFKAVKFTHWPANFKPRGIINRGNSCYINCVLQALIACPPFFHFMKNCPHIPPGRNYSITPMLDAVWRLFREFTVIRNNPHMPKKEGSYVQDPSIDPDYLLSRLDQLGMSVSVQEDADELLGCLLNSLHEEMVACIQLADPAANRYPDRGQNSDDWEQVGRRNKSIVTRTINVKASPISELFCGRLKNVIYLQGKSETANVEPFFTLAVDIQDKNVSSIREALEFMLRKEPITDYKSATTRKDVDASCRMSLEHLPPVLILHLKRFLYVSDGAGGKCSQKIDKVIHFDMQLDMPRDCFPSRLRSEIGVDKIKNYRLFAIVYHHGKSAEGGHYSTMFYHTGCQGWLHADDTNLTFYKQQQVIHNPISGVPYLLCYRKIDFNPRYNTT